MTNISYGNSEKSFLECENYRFKKYLLALTQLIKIFFIFLLLISNHTVFIIQFEINLQLWILEKDDFTLAEAACAISALWKTHSSKLTLNWTRNCMITSTNIRSANKFKQFVELRIPDSPIASVQLTSWQPILDDKNKSISLLWEPQLYFHFHLLYCHPAGPSSLATMSRVCKPRTLNLMIVHRCFMMFWLLMQ